MKPVATRKFEQFEVVLIGNPGIMSMTCKLADSITVGSACYTSSSREKNSYFAGYPMIFSYMAG